MNILITGAAGFIGSNLIKRIHNQGLKYNGLDDLSFGCKENSDGYRVLYTGFETFSKEYLNQFDVLIHLACANLIYAQDHQVKTFEINALNTFRLFRDFKGKIIYTSTASVYGQADHFPVQEDSKIKVSNSYDQSKYLAEMYLQLRGDFTTLRLSNVYGYNQRPEHPYSGVIGKLIGNALQKKRYKIIGSGMATRDYTFIDDVLDAIILAALSPAFECPINIATGIETTPLKIAYMISEIMKTPFDVEFLNERSIDNISRRCLDIKRAHDLLGWEPNTDLQKGLELTINYQKQK